MNRKLPDKKNYFSFLSDLFASRQIRNGLLFVVAVAVISIGWIVFAKIEMDASAVFAIFTLVTLPIIVLATVFYGFEKITGFSCLRGVEWVGKRTLQLFDWLYVQIQHGLGLEAKAKRHSKSQAPVKQEVFLQKTEQIEQIVPPESTIPEKREPEFSDFSMEQEPEDPLKDLEYIDLALAKSDKPPVFLKAETPAAMAVEDVVTNDVAEQTLEEDNNTIALALATPSATAWDSSTDEHAVNNPASSLLDNSLDALEKVTRLTTSIADESPDSTPLDDIQSADPEQSAEIVTPEISRPDYQQPDAEEPLNPGLKAILDKVENTAQDPKSPDSETEQIDNKVATNKTDDNPPREASASSLGKIEETPAALQPTMLAQAEKTAASILSSISQKFTRSSEQLATSFSQTKESDFHLPTVELLEVHQQSVLAYSTEELDEISRTVERVLKDYKVIAEVVGAYPGPIITRFELLLAPGVKVSRVSGLAKDLARAMLVTSVRVVEIIEGTPYIGLEIPNQERELVSFREIIASDNFQQAVSPITFALGKDVSGQTVVADLAKMPHLLVAGTTGSGKSVAINTMILSMLYKATPDQVRMIMVDPKMLELSIYEGIPHLLTPVVTDMKEAQNALRWAVAEMERRYKLMSKVGVRNLAGYNLKIEQAAERGETIRDPIYQLVDPLAEGEEFPVLSTLPNIVIVIDELADMMMIVGKKVEELIARLAQKARAAGIHLVLATQRPSVDVLTGLIKANVPTRISFQVSSRIDSRTILDQGGAEALLGNGDMLYLPSGTSIPIRSHGAFVGDDEVHAVVDYLKTQGQANYLTEITEEAATEQAANSESVQNEVDALYNDAVSFVLETGRASISSVQRRFKVGYNRAARMIDQMEEDNIVSEPEGNGSRRVLNREQ